MSTPSKWEHFSKEELTCKCGCGQMLMDDYFMSKLVRIRKMVGFPLIVTSGYRCPAYNSRIADTGLTGPHTTGHAIDIHVTGAQAMEVVRAALDVGMSGLGLAQKGDYKSRFIHLDDLNADLVHNRNRPHMWTY